VRRLLVSWFVLAALATVALLVAHWLAPGRFALELDVFVLAVGGLAVLDVVILVREAFPAEGEPAIVAALEREEQDEARPPELERLERELTMATATAFDLHARLRPLLRQIAAMKLGARGRRLEAGEQELGEELWELLRPDRKPPTDRHAAGIDPAALRRAVERLEAL
jgi:hypothetical protein